MMTDILQCHQPNRHDVVQMMYRADFYGLQGLSKQARENGDYKGQREYDRKADIALHRSVDDNSFSRRWHIARD